MKRKIAPLALIPLLLLVSCASDPTTNDSQNSGQGSTQVEKSVEQIFEENLNLLKKGYASFHVGKQTSYPNNRPTQSESSKIISETSAIDDKFTIKMFDVDESGQPIQAAIETVYNVDGDACNGRININNGITYFKILHPSGNGVFRFQEDGYSNFYKNLDIKDFIKTSDRTFTLKKGEASLNKVYKDIGTQTYGNPGFSIKTFQIYVSNDNKLTTTTIFNKFVGKSYTYEYSFESELRPISVSEFSDRNETYQPIKDEKFEKAIKSLQAQNYTLTQVDQDEEGNILKKSTLLANKDKFYSETFDSNNLPMNIGIYQDGETYQSVTKGKDGSFIKGNLSTKEDFNNYYSPFLINRAVFDFDNKNTYTLKKYIDGDTYVFSPYETDASELNQTTIEILDDKIIFTNQFGKKGHKLVATFTNIGTTNVGYDKTSVIEQDTVNYQWQELLTSDQYDNLLAFVGDLTLLPVPKNLNDSQAWSLATSGNARQIKYASASMPASEKDVTNYRQVLTNLGYEIFVEGENPMYKKDNLYVQVYSDGATLYIDLQKL